MESSTEKKWHVHSLSGWLEHGTFRQQENANVAGAQFANGSVGSGLYPKSKGTP